MITILIALFGLLPAIVIAVPAFVCLLVGLGTMFDDPAQGALLIAWASAGLYGTRTLIQVASGTCTENTVPGLLAGIAAAAPLAYLTILGFDFPDSLPLLYFTVSPIVIATGYIADMTLREPRDDARIIEYEDA